MNEAGAVAFGKKISVDFLLGFAEMDVSLLVSFPFVSSAFLLLYSLQLSCPPVYKTHLFMLKFSTKSSGASKTWT